MHKHDEAIKRSFESKFVVTPGCWLWQLSKNEKGYGQFHIKSYPHRAHRISYELYVGEIPSGMHVLHKCDNPSCVNPAHLSVGTNLDNMRDRDSKGRNTVLRGSMQKSSKLTESDAQRILSDTRTHQAIASEFGVSRSLIGAIKAGKRWPHARATFQANHKLKIAA